MRVLLAGAAGADGIVMDGLDRASVGDALAGVEPEVVIHQLRHWRRWGTSRSSTRSSRRLTGCYVRHRASACRIARCLGETVHRAELHRVAAVTPATDLEGLALRYGSFYGPGTGLAKGGDMLKMVAKRRLPVVGGAGAVRGVPHRLR
jgi:hypothetical protein